MRPQQQNRRMRGRNNGGGSGGNNNNNNNNNRRGPNPLTRNYESNGPDVKIRGSAQQIAEKYATLARDAQSAGDRVMAENYLQHAEHYNRIIAAAQAQFASQQIQAPRDDLDDDLDDAPYGFGNGMNGAGDHHQPPAQAPVQPQQSSGSGPQPVIEGVPAEVALNSEPAGQPTGGGRHRERRHQHHRHQNGADDAGVAKGDAAAAGPQQELALTEPEQTQEAGEPAVVANEAPPVETAPAEEQPRPRRGRRPRRAARGDETAEAGNADAPDQVAATSETGGNDGAGVSAEG